MRIGVRAGIGGGGSDAETLRSHRPPPPTAASHPLGAERGWGRSDRCPPQPGGRPQISRIVPALSPQPQSGWQPATGMEPRLGDGGDLEGDGGGGSGRGGGQQVRPYLIPGRGGGGAQEGEQPAQPHPAASRPRVAAAAPPPRPPRPRSSSGAAAVRGQQPGRERRAPPPLPEPRRLGWGLPSPPNAPQPRVLRGTKDPRDHRGPTQHFGAAPSQPERRRLFPPSHPPGPAAGTANPPPPPVAMRFVPSERRGGSQRTPGPLGCSGGIGVSTALGRSGTQPASPLLERLHQRPPVLSSNRTAGSAADTAQKSEGSAQPQGSRHSSVPTPSLWRRQRFCGSSPTAGRSHSGNQPKHPWKQPTQRAAKSLWHPRFGPVILWNPRGAAGWGHPCPCPTKGIHCLSGFGLKCPKRSRSVHSFSTQDYGMSSTHFEGVCQVCLAKRGARKQVTNLGNKKTQQNN